MIDKSASEDQALVDQWEKDRASATDVEANPELGVFKEDNPDMGVGESLIEQDLLPPKRKHTISIKVAGDMVEIPIVLGWKVLMRPKRAKTATEWGFELSNKATVQEAYANYVSQILAIGEGCFQARDQGGVDMSKFVTKPKVGDWVIHTPYSGYRIRMRGMTEIDYLIVMDDTEIHCITNNPDDYFGVIDVSKR